MQKLEKILLFLVILFLPTQLGKHFWPQFSYIYSLKIDYLSPTLYFWDILAAGLLIIWVLQKPHINKMALNLVLLFLFTQALSLIKASNIGAGMVRLEQYGIAGFFGVYLASFNFKDWPRQIYLPLALGVMGESILTTLQFIKGSTLGFWILGERSFSISTPGIAKFDFYGQEFLRPYGTFSHPNVLAGFLLLGVSIIYLLKERKKWINLTLMLASAAIFLTMSRTVILAGFLMGFSLLRKKWLMFAAFIILMLSPVLFTRFSSLLNFDNLTVLRREELLSSAWQMFLKFPFYGVGLNNFIPAMANQLVAGPSRFLQPVHNIFLLALSETGLIGLVGLIGLIGIPILSSRRMAGSINNTVKWIRHWRMTVPWLIIIFLGMFDHYFLTLPQGYRLLFLIWGLSFSKRLVP